MELIMVIVIMGIVGGMVSVFMKSPIDAYFASARRAALTDVADTTVRRMARDIRKALPNSLRQSSDQCIEFISTKTGGRYRAEEVAPGDDSSLDFSKVDSTFHMLGDNSTLLAAQKIVPTDLIAVYNLGITGANAYALDNTAVVSAVAAAAETTITLSPGKQFPLASGSNRFHVIPGDEQVVSYVCNGSNELRRTVRTLAASATQCPATGPAILASNVGACTFIYNGNDLQRNALVQLNITFTDSGESVGLYHEVHVDNTP